MTTLAVAPQTSDLDLAELLLRVGVGSTASFAELYDRFASVLHGISGALLQDPGEAEDATEEALLEIWRSAARYQAIEDPERWLLAAVVRSVGRRLSTSVSSG